MYRWLLCPGSFILCLASAVSAGQAQSPQVTAPNNLPGHQAPRQLSPEEQAEAESLRALMKATPLLRFERVELEIKPALTLGLISAVTADKKGHIYILNRPNDPSADPVIVVDRNGNFLRSFGGGLFKTPHSIRFDPQGHLWIVDAHTSTVFEFTPDGKKLLEFAVGDIPDARRAFCGATDVAFAPNGHLYISDGYCNGRFLEYTRDGKRLRVWGRRGKAAGEFNLAHDITVSPGGIVYVADRENGRLQWFDMNGTYLGEKRLGGQVFSVVSGQKGDLYVGVHVRGVDYDQDAVIFKLDPQTGAVMGRLDGFAHLLGIGADGSLYPGTGVNQIGGKPPMSAILVYRPRK